MIGYFRAVCGWAWQPHFARNGHVVMRRKRWEFRKPTKEEERDALEWWATK